MSTSPVAERPSLQVEGGRAIIRLNRPKQHNRFEPADVSAITGMLEELEAPGKARVLVVSASGPSFSAGLDLGSMVGEVGVEATAAFRDMCDRLERFPAPTICGLNGSVYGGATDFALACDIRIGVENSRLIMPAAGHGLQFYYGGLRRYVEKIGSSATRRLFLTGEPVDSETMLRIGFLSELVPLDRLEHRLETLAEACAERSPAALRGLKSSLNEIARGMADPSEIDARFFASLGSADANEGLKAWVEKRRPSFPDALRAPAPETRAR